MPLAPSHRLPPSACCYLRSPGEEQTDLKTSYTTASFPRSARACLRYLRCASFCCPMEFRSEDCLDALGITIRPPPSGCLLGSNRRRGRPVTSTSSQRRALFNATVLVPVLA